MNSIIRPTSLLRKMNFRYILFTLSLVAQGFMSMAQYPGFKPVPDMAAFKSKYKQESQKIQDIGSTFVQEKTLSALTETIRSEGKFWFKKQNKLRIEYIKPTAYLLIMNGDQVKIKDNGKENTMQASSSKVFKKINELMLECIQGTALDSKDFSSIVLENEKEYLIEMTPMDKALKGFFKRIILHIEKSNFTARSITMLEPSGDSTVITFQSKKINQGVNDSLFNL